MAQHHILYSFRRCPYAMRARLALFAGEVPIELREITLKNKPTHMVDISPKATVPVLLTHDGLVIEESLEIIFWVMQHYHIWQNDRLDDMKNMIAQCDDMFKYHLDRYKYAARYSNENPHDFSLYHRAQAMNFIQECDEKLQQQSFLFADTPTLADYAIFPFIRQFAKTDENWWQNIDYCHVIIWLNNMLSLPLFVTIMQKFPIWNGRKPLLFHQ